MLSFNLKTSRKVKGKNEQPTETQFCPRHLFNTKYFVLKSEHNFLTKKDIAELAREDYLSAVKWESVYTHYPV